MGELDIAAKALLREEPEAFVRLALPGRDIKAITPDETELHVLERRMDKLLRVELADEPEPVWVHVEVEAVWAADVPRRVFGYWSLAHQTRPAVRSLALVLAPGERQGEPTNGYAVSVLGDRVLSFGFDVVCAWKLEVSDLLAAREPGLLPLIPFAKGARPEHIEEAFHTLAADRGSVDLQVALAAFSHRVFPGRPWFAKIEKEVLVESGVFQELLVQSGLFHELRVEAHRQVLAPLLRVKLGKGTRTEALVSRLSLCDEATLGKIGPLLVSSKKKPALFAAIERLLPKTPAPE